MTVSIQSGLTADLSQTLLHQGSPRHRQSLKQLEPSLPRLELKEQRQHLQLRVKHRERQQLPPHQKNRRHSSSRRTSHQTVLRFHSSSHTRIRMRQSHRQLVLQRPRRRLRLQLQLKKRQQLKNQHRRRKSQRRKLQLRQKKLQQLKPQQNKLHDETIPKNFLTLWINALIFFYQPILMLFLLKRELRYNKHRSELFHPRLTIQNHSERQRKFLKIFSSRFSYSLNLQTNSFPKRKSTEKLETTSTQPSWSSSSRNKRQHNTVELRDVDKSLDVAWKIPHGNVFLFVLISRLTQPTILTHFNQKNFILVSQNYIFFCTQPLLW